EKNYDMMTKWIAYQSLDSRQNYGIRKVDGVQVPNESNFSEMPYIQVQQRRGDHLAYDESTPFILSATAYAARVAQLMAKTAEILGKTDDAAMYRNRFDNIKKAFNDAWVKDNGSIAYWGEMSKSSKDINGNIINKTYYSNDADNPNHPSQTAYALAIDFGLISKEKLERAGECLKQSILDMDGHLSVGFLGISHLAPALTKAGLISAAFDLLEKESNPSWLYSVINGATTIWERWDSYVAETDTFGDVAMNSFNHYSYGAIGEWMYKNILGIAPDDENPGYKHIILKPAFGGSLTYAKGWHESPYGKIEAEWELNSGNFLYSCTIPPNTTASLYLPTDNPMKVEFDANDAQWAAFARINNGKIVYELVSGKYTFKVKLG
ncbi:MAG: hypothetical protein N2171_08320, partial [Clostridia bacterium]|nr:hypothetical protein [Clostridia bacterium]